MMHAIAGAAPVSGGDFGPLRSAFVPSWAMPNHRLVVEYEGTRYRGWQEQPGQRTVAGEIRRAAQAAGAQVVELMGSGRTDAGVHALAQTAHLRTERELDPERFRMALNDALPSDIHVLAVVRADDRFHARHAATLRSYLYQVSRRRSALGKRFVWWVKRPLDAAAMAAALAAVEGRHDFRAFCERPQAQTSTVVVVERAELAQAGDLIVIRLAASHFLWKMVRRIVGILVEVGAGKLAESDFERLVCEPPDDPAPLGVAAWTAPPSGLFLERAVYPGEPPIGALGPAVPLRAAGVPTDALYTGERPAPKTRRRR
jgi:tRNA pseudouridine38-40 synthase